MRFPALKPTVMAVALSGAMFFVACGGGDDDDDDPTTEPTGTSEPTATATMDDGGNGGGGDLVVAGEPVGEYYANNCSACHGENREGITGLGKPLLPDELVEDDAFYADTIANGRSGTVMPAWADAGLTDADIDALVAFIRTEP